jgi:hypothetical protein
MDAWLSKLSVQLQWRSEPGLWVLASLLLYVLSAQVARWSPIARMLGWLIDRDVLGPIWWAVRLAYLAGIPYLVLLTGAASPRGMGLSGQDWVRTLGVGVPLAGLAWLLILLGWHQARSLASEQVTSDDEAPASAYWLPAAYWLTVALEAGGQQMHWAFYRDAAIRWLGTYWGAWASVLLLGLEWGSNPATWRAGQAPDQARSLLLRLLLAIVTTVLYLSVSNWWLNWGLHMLALLGTRVPVGLAMRHDPPTLDDGSYNYAVVS